VAKAATTQCDDGVGAIDSPERSGTFQPCPDHSFAAGLDDAGANEQPLFAEGRIAHSIGIAREVLGFVGCDSGEFCIGGRGLAENLSQRFDLASLQSLQTARHPPLANFLVQGEELGREFPEMLTGVEEINDLDGAWKVLVGETPDPDGAVADHDLLLSPAPTTPPVFVVKP